MGISILEGCQAIDVDPAFVRLHAPGGHMQTIPWSAILLAALPAGDVHMKFEGDLSPITRLRETHDALWIQVAGGMNVVMLERDDPKRGAIVEAFQANLGDKWKGEHMSPQQLTNLMFNMAKISMDGAGNSIKIMVIAMAVFMLIAVVIFFLAQARH